MIPSIQKTKAPTNHPIAITVPQADGTVHNDSFFHPLLSFVMTCNEHATVTKYLKLKPLICNSPMYTVAITRVIVLYEDEDKPLVFVIAHNR